MIKKVVKVLWIFIALITLTCVVIFFSIAKGWIGYMPPVEDLENPNYKFATEIFSKTGKFWELILIARRIACLWDTMICRPILSMR